MEKNHKGNGMRNHELDQHLDWLDACFDEEGYEELRERWNERYVGYETDPQYEDGDLVHDLDREDNDGRE